MKIPCPRCEPVDTSGPYFELVHSRFKQTAARVGRTRSGDRVALEFLLPDDPQAEQVRVGIRADLSARLERLAPVARTLDELFGLLERACCHPANLYTEVHWLYIDPDLAEPGV